MKPQGYTTDQAVAEERLAKDEVDLVVVFPPDPVETVLAGERAEITVIHDELDPIQQTAIEFADAVGGRRGEQHDPGPHRGRRPGLRPAPRAGQGRAAHLGDRARLRRRFAGRRHRRAPGRRAGDLGRGRLGAPRRDPRPAGAVRGPARRRPAAAPRRSPHHAGVDPHHGGRRRIVGGRGQGGRRGRADQRRRAARQPALRAAVGRSRGARAALRRHHARRPRRARGHHRLLRACSDRAAGATSGCDLRGPDLRARSRPGAVRGAAGRPGDRACRTCSASTSPTR